MLHIYKTLTLIVTFMLFSSCVTYTPMSRRDIDDVTTCNNTTLKKIKKNLLLGGYEIKKESAEDLTTEYKQTSGYGANRDYEKITVIQMDKGVFKFVVKEREDGMTSVSTGRTTTTTTKYKRSGRSRSSDTSTSGYQAMATSNESDKNYYVEKRAQYDNLHYTICGR